MGYGILSGLGPAAGLYGALATALVSAVVGGARGVIAGPNVVVAMIVAVVVTDHASSLAEAATIGVMAGAIQIVFAVLRLGRYVIYVPQSLISGFFTAFGILVIASQTFLALGVDGGGVGLIDNFRELPRATRESNVEALTLAVLCLILGALWRERLARLLPAAFIVLVFGSALGTLAAALVIGLVVTWLLNARRLEELEMRSLASVPLLDASVLNRDEVNEADRFRARSGLVVLPDRVTMASARQIGRVLRVDLSQHRAIIVEMSRIQFLDD